MREPHHPAQHQRSDRSSTIPQKPARILSHSSRHLLPAPAFARNRNSLHPPSHNLERYPRLGQLLPRVHQRNHCAHLPSRTQRPRERSRSPAWPTSKVSPSMSPVRFLRPAHYRGANGATLQTLGPNMRSARCLSQISLRWSLDC
jgi:hypothetical protein